MVGAFGFGTSTRESKNSNEIPGPGQYAQGFTNKNQTPQWRLGTSKRVEPGTENKHILLVPSPTKYEVPSKIGEGPKIGLSPRLEVLDGKMQRVVPGPGQYTPNTSIHRNNLSYSFGLKTTTSNNKYIESVPGPGQYDFTKKALFNRIGASLDKSNRDAALNKTQILVPGPGQYNATSIMNKTASPKYGFGTAGRRVSTCFEQSRNTENPNMTFRTSSAMDVPGPGNYRIQSKIGAEGQKKTMSGRFNFDQATKEESEKPGPGQYVPSLDPVARATANFKFGTSTRQHYYLKDKFLYDLPSSGQYNPKLDIIKKQGPAAGFGYGDRSQIGRSNNASPGPGSYQALSKVGEGPKFIMGLKLEDQSIQKKAQNSPSPGAYSPKVEAVKQKDSVFSLGKAKRPAISTQREVPGPGNYDIFNKTFQASAGGFGFGSSPQRPDILRRSFVPGPGQYKLKSTFADVPKYLIPNQKDELNYV